MLTFGSIFPTRCVIGSFCTTSTLHPSSSCLELLKTRSSVFTYTVRPTFTVNTFCRTIKLPDTNTNDKLNHRKRNKNRRSIIPDVDSIFQSSVVQKYTDLLNITHGLRRYWKLFIFHIFFTETNHTNLTFLSHIYPEKKNH